MRVTFSYFLIILLLSCEEPFEFTTDRSEATQFVFDGFIDQSDRPHGVSISQTSSAGAPSPIINASVWLEDHNGNRYEMEEDEPGVYETSWGEVKGEKGSAYRISATLASGEQFQSVWDTIPRYKSTDSITWREYLKTFTSDLGGDFGLPVVSVNLISTFDTLTESIFTLWRAEETYQFIPTDFPDPFGSIPEPCYFIQQFGSEQVNLFSNLGRTDRSFIIEEFFFREIDDSFLRKHIFSVYQLSISSANYEYMRAIETLVENSGSLFDNPPGQAIGNIKAVSGTETNALGFFGAVLTDTTRIAVYPTQLETFIVDDCEYTPEKEVVQYSDECRTCWILPRSTGRPGYWLDY